MKDIIIEGERERRRHDQIVEKENKELQDAMQKQIAKSEQKLV